MEQTLYNKYLNLKIFLTHTMTANHMLERKCYF